MAGIAGTLFIISAPSGAGKTSLVKALTEMMRQVVISVSHTTRPQRPGEQPGVDYHFIDEKTFEKNSAQGLFLEHAQVFQHHYGTDRRAVEANLEAGNDVILEIDWQGARQVREQCPHAVGIFIIPPSLQDLKKRLTGRGQDDNDVITHRLSKAQAEISHYDEYDYLVINDDFHRALADIQAIFCTHRLQCQRQKARYAALLQGLQDV